MRGPLLTLRPLDASNLARAALAAIGTGDLPILDAAHFQILDRFDEGETGYLVTATTTNRYSLHHVTFAVGYTEANGPAEFTLPATAMQWILTHANDFGNDAHITITTADGNYTITILKGARGTERMTLTGRCPKGTYPNVASLVTTAVTAATAPIEIHQYSASTLRAALAVIAAVSHDRSTVTFKQTAQRSGRPAGPLLITVDAGSGSTWRVLIQPQGVASEGGSDR